MTLAIEIGQNVHLEGAGAEEKGTEFINTPEFLICKAVSNLCSTPCDFEPPY